MSAVTVPPVAWMMADAVPSSCDERSGIWLKSQARRMLRSGTTVPLSALAGTAEHASKMRTGIAQRDDVENVTDILSIIPVREADTHRSSARYPLHQVRRCDVHHRSATNGQWPSSFACFRTFAPVSVDSLSSFFVFAASSANSSMDSSPSSARMGTSLTGATRHRQG